MNQIFRAEVHDQKVWGGQRTYLYIIFAMMKKEIDHRGNAWLVVAGLFLLVMFACGEENQLRALDKGNVEKEVRLMLKNYHLAISEKGLEAEFDYLDSSSDFFWVPPGYDSALSFESVKEVLLEKAPYISAVYQWDSLEVYPLAPYIANFHGVVSGSVIDIRDSSGVPQQVRMIESGTVILRSSGWKLLSGHTSLFTLEVMATAEPSPPVLPDTSTVEQVEVLPPLDNISGDTIPSVDSLSVDTI